MDTCYHCKYYYVTWDDKFPHGCRAMQFKSRESPALVVWKNSGTECLLKTPRARIPPADKKGKKRSLLDRKI